MKSKLYLIITIVIIFLSLSVTAEVDRSKRYGVVYRLPPYESGVCSFKITVYGIEKTEDKRLGAEDISDKDGSLLDSISEFVGENDIVIFFKCAWYDAETKEILQWDSNVDLLININKREGGMWGKDYRVYFINNGNVNEKTVLDNADTRTLEFETNELGVFAVVADKNALTFTFYLDDEKQVIYKQYENLNRFSTIAFPEPPEKEGYEFAGWKMYNESTGAEFIMEEGMCIADAGVRAVASWTQTLTDIGEKENDGNERYVRIHE